MLRFILFLLLSLSSLYAQELDDLLTTYTHNSDLSEKTKHENGGTVTIFTRQDLEMMQAHTLKDLLKSHPVLRYKESRSGLPDMQYNGGSATFSSNNIRIYVDNQELTSATYGSGFPMANNINLNVIDHVEIYTRSPSYEFSTEPTYILIKLYTKLAERHRGGSLNVSYGNRDFNEQALFYADEFEDLSYVASLSRRDDRKKEYKSHEVPIKRDTENYTFLGSLYSEKHKLQLMAGKSDIDTSISRSPTATYETSNSNYDYLHLGYETSYFKDTSISFGYQQTNIDGQNAETAGFETPFSPSFEYDRSEEVLTAELKHNIETQNNRLIFGAKYRYKSFEINSLTTNGVETNSPIFTYDRQEIFTLFAEERYSISDHNIVNFAGQYAHVKNNDSVDSADLLQFRVNHTYVVDEFIFKTFVYRVESLVEPYIYINYNTTPSLDTQVLHAISEEIKYEVDKSELKLVVTYNEIEDRVTESPLGTFINSNEKMKMTSGYLEHTYRFDVQNKLISNVSYSYTDPFGKNEVAAFIRSLNAFGKFDLFNELIYNHNDINHEQYYDYSAGLRYHYNKTLTLSIKGENIFDTGYEDAYFRLDPTSPSFAQDEPIMISPVEQRFFVSLEYLF